MPSVSLPYTFPSPVQTERLTLRLMTPDDVDDIYAYQSREDVCRYLLFEPRDRAVVTEKVAQHAQAVTLAAEGDYWQIAMEREGRVIGDLYFTLASTEHATGEIGWTLHPDHQGNGYVTEGATAILRLAFEAIELHRVKAQLDGRNTARRRCASGSGCARRRTSSPTAGVKGRVDRHRRVRPTQERAARSGRALSRHDRLVARRAGALQQ